MSVALCLRVAANGERFATRTMEVYNSFIGRQPADD